MESIDQKIMAFVGTEECSDLISELARYTDRIYAAVSDSYGRSSSPGGNITLISSFLDAEGIQRWMDRTGIEVIIDGTSPDAEASELIRSKASENGIEYLHIKKDYTLSRGIHVCEKRDEIISGLRYTSEKILIESPDMYSFLTENGIDASRLVVMTKPDPGEISALRSAGCEEKNMLCFGMKLSSGFLLSLFDELAVSYYIINPQSRGMAEKSEALNHSDVKAFLDGALKEEEGMTGSEMLSMLKKRYGLR